MLIKIAQKMLNLSNTINFKKQPIHLFTALMPTIFVLSGCVTALTGIKSVPTNKFLQNSVAFGNVQIPLPEGSWIVTGQGEYKTWSGIYMGQLTLASFQGNVIKGLITVTTNFEGSPKKGAWKPTKQCARENLFYNSGVKQENITGRCWFVSHSKVLSPESTSIRIAASQSLQFMKNNGVKMPTNMEYVGYDVFGITILLRVKYYFNPDIAAITPTKFDNWYKSDWNKARINKFPRKLAYVQALTTWGAEWENKVMAGYNRRLASSTTPLANNRPQINLPPKIQKIIIPAENFAAIVYSPSTRKWRRRWQQASPQLAIGLATSECGEIDCVPVLVYAKKTCGTIATGDGNAYGVGVGAKKVEATKTALANCSTVGQNCVVAIPHCNK